MDTSSEQRQCSIIEPERNLCFSTHLTCALPPEGAAMPLAAAVNPQLELIDVRMPCGSWSLSGTAGEARF